MVLLSCAGVFVSSWFGGLLLQLADWIIKKLPLIKHIYSAAKQVRCTHHTTNSSFHGKLLSSYVCVLVAFGTTFKMIG